MVLKRIKLWLHYLHPFETEKLIQQNKEKASLKNGAVNVFLSSLIPAVIILILFIAIAVFVGSHIHNVHSLISLFPHPLYLDAFTNDQVLAIVLGQ